MFFIIILSLSFSSLLSLWVFDLFLIFVFCYVARPPSKTTVAVWPSRRAHTDRQTRANFSKDRDMSTLEEICSNLPVDPLPPSRTRNPSVPHAPVRNHRLNPTEQKVRFLVFCRVSSIAFAFLLFLELFIESACQCTISPYGISAVECSVLLPYHYCGSNGYISCTRFANARPSTVLKHYMALWHVVYKAPDHLWRSLMARHAFLSHPPPFLAFLAVLV